MKIFSIIVTYNAMEWLDKCLFSLRQSTIPTIPVIIDNCSTDATISHIKSNYPEVILFEQKQNLGFGKGNNVGIEYAIKEDADFVLLLNQDAWIEKDMIEKLLAHNDYNSLLSPIHLNGSGEFLDPNFRKNSILNNINNSLVDDLFLQKNKKKYQVEYVNAACWLLPVVVAKKIGGFNPLFFQYGEDNNYLQRLKYHNILVFVIADTFVFHDRKMYGNKKMYDKNKIYRNLLMIKTNINNTRRTRFVENSKCFIVEIYTCFTGRTIRPLFTFMSAKIKLFFQYDTIKKSIKAEKQIGFTWLNNN